jgi:TonB family protein
MGANYERGIVCYQTKQFKTAEKQFREELSQSPDSAAAHAMLGMTLTALKKSDQGHKEALESVRLLPYYAYGHYTLSFTFAALNKPKEAEKAIIEAIRLNPEEAYLFARASQIYFIMKKFPKALEMADLGLQCDATHEECLINRGASLLEMNRLSEAEEAVNQALAIAPESYTAHINQGAVQLRLFNQPKAFEHYREALRLNPNSEQARIGVVESLKAKNPLYHGLLRFSIMCRSMPPWAVACCLLLVIFPPTRIILGALLIIYTIANYMFELALHLDPVGRTFIDDKRKQRFNALKASRLPILMVIFGVSISIFVALAPSHDPHYRYRHKHMDEPVSSMQFANYGTYMEYIQRRIKSYWEPPKKAASNSTMVHFVVDRDGIVSKVTASKSSGFPDVDQAAVKAVLDASPLPKLPPTKDKSVEVEFSFHYNYRDENGVKIPAEATKPN